MAGRFEGLSDLEWKLFEDIFPETPKKRSRGMPPTPFRYVLNSLLYILITGCPKGYRSVTKGNALVHIDGAIYHKEIFGHPKVQHIVG